MQKPKNHKISKKPRPRWSQEGPYWSEFGSKLLYFFGMDKSLKLDETTYPFVPCHDFCENDCTADVYFTKKVRERFKEIGIEKDRGNMFLSLLSYISKEKHSFLNLESKDEEVDKYLKCMKVFSSSDVKKIFRHAPGQRNSPLQHHLPLRRPA